MIRRRLRNRLRRGIVSSSEPLADRWLERRTLVLAPHPDDETLGCGGLVAALRQRQVCVHIAFMTDGSGSHAGCDLELASRRRDEAVAASEVLGVDEACLTFLDYPDGALATIEEEAADRLASLLSTVRPGQLVVPHWAEPNADHAATYRIAELAARRSGETLEALLAPVWLWDQFPWVAPFAPPPGRHGRRELLKLMLRSRVGFGMGRWLTHHLELGELATIKRSALAKHASQVTRPAGDLDWPILADVAAGEWLGLLLEAEELFGTARLGEREPSQG